MNPSTGANAYLSDSSLSGDSPATTPVRRSAGGATWLWPVGGICFLAFYAALHQFPQELGFLHRYCTSHPLEYVATGLFCVGVIQLVRSLLRIAVARRALSAAEQAVTGENQVDDMPQLVERLPWSELREAAERLHDAARGGLSGEPLTLRAEQVAGELAQRRASAYGVVQTVAWAIPIIGFLGTVIGITLAIANVSPEQLEHSLSSVTGGLAVAFDTTAQALGLSLMLVFAQFFVRQSDESLALRMDRFLIEQLVPRLSGQSGAGQITGAIASAVRDQGEAWMAAWRGELNRSALQWLDGVQQQQAEISQQLTGLLQQTIQTHEQVMTASRDHFLTGLVTVTRDLTAAIAASAAQQSLAQQQLQGEVERLTVALSEHTAGLSAHVAQWHTLQTDHERLTGLQLSLNDNLRAIRDTQTFEQTVQTLGGVVQLLTARVSKAA